MGRAKRNPSMGGGAHDGFRLSPQPSLQGNNRRFGLPGSVLVSAAQPLTANNRLKRTPGIVVGLRVGPVARPAGHGIAE